MKVISFYVSLLATVMMSVPALANDFAIAISPRSNTADVDGTGTAFTVGSKIGLSAGVLGLFDMGNNLQVRTGFFFTQRNYTITPGNMDINLTYVDIPVTGVYRFADYAGAFAGPVIALLASKECKATPACGTFNPEALNIGLQLGATFKFAPQLGAEIFYEMLPSSFVPTYLKSARTIGANFLFTFE